MGQDEPLPIAKSQHVNVEGGIENQHFAAIMVLIASGKSFKGSWSHWWQFGEERGCMLSLEISPQRLHVTHTKDKVVVAVEEPGDTLQPSHRSGCHHQQDTLVSASRERHQERHNCTVKVSWPRMHNLDLNVRKHHTNHKQLYKSKRSVSQKTKK